VNELWRTREYERYWAQYFTHQLDKGIQRQLRFLKGYAVISSALLAALFFIAATQSGTLPAGKASFEEIDVARINILEGDGTPRYGSAFLEIGSVRTTCDRAGFS
jgi:hypothetical protein